LPTVVVGLGRAGIMLAILGQRLAAPWIYAALERGMEAYPGQPTIDDLTTIYRYRDIQKSTRFVGVTGFGEREVITTAALNAVFAQEQSAYRCLPMGVGDLKVFRKVMDAAKLGAVVVDADHQHDILSVGAEAHGAARTTQAADVLIHKGDAWHALDTAALSRLEALRHVVVQKFPGDNPFKGRIVVIVGLNAAARGLAAELQRQGANTVIASHRKKAGFALAQELGCRFVQFEALYSTLHDVLVVCEEEKPEDASKPGGAGIHAGYLKPGMIVMDLTAAARKSPLLADAELRGCLIVAPRELLLQQIDQQARTLTGKPPDRKILEDAIPERYREE
jgi:3-dehydroquinate dehydratase/shikimate dehydrogenase